ncbi:MAG: hypothetical protein GF405_04795 [Candidatus Eisenbacteria bacterium]|nr:hypothetical protein [Candidatus Eisenbacteria bacterium]
MRRLFVLLAIAGLLFGCKSTTTGPDEAEDTYTLRDSPANALVKLNEAYEAMDTDAYLDCLAEDFAFHLAQVDIDNDASLPEYWGRTTEQTIHQRMFGDEEVSDPSLEVEQITLTLTTITWGHDVGADPGDPMDDRWTYRVDTDLMVYFPNSLNRRADAVVEFVLRIDQDDTGPDGETLYEIVRWEDLAASSGRTEETTWGTLKAMYR